MENTAERDAFDDAMEIKFPLDAEGRVRLYVQLFDSYNMGAQIIYDKRFESEGWGYGFYGLKKGDLEYVLGLLRTERHRCEGQERTITDLMEQLRKAKEAIGALRSEVLLLGTALDRLLKG